MGHGKAQQGGAVTLSLFRGQNVEVLDQRSLQGYQAHRLCFCQHPELLSLHQLPSQICRLPLGRVGGHKLRRTE